MGEKKRSLKSLLDSKVSVPSSYERYLSCDVVEEKEDSFVVQTPRKTLVFFSVRGGSLKKLKQEKKNSSSKKEDSSASLPAISTDELQSIQDRLDSIQKVAEEDRKTLLLRIRDLEEKVENLESELKQEKSAQKELANAIAKVGNSVVAQNTTTHSPEAHNQAVVETTPEKDTPKEKKESTTRKLYLKSKENVQAWRTWGKKRFNEKAPAFKEKGLELWRAYPNLIITIACILAISLFAYKLVDTNNTNKLNSNSDTSTVSHQQDPAKSGTPTPSIRETNTSKNDNERYNRWARHEAVMEYGDDSGASTQELVEQLGSDVDNDRIEAIKILSAKNGKHAGRHILKLLDDPSPEVVANAVECLGKIQYTTARTKVLKIIKDSNKGLTLRIAAISSIGNMGGESAKKELIALALDQQGDVDLREAALVSAGRMNIMGGLHQFKILLEDPHPVIRAATANVFEATSYPSAIPELQKLAMKDSDDGVREAAIKALGNMVRNPDGIAVTLLEIWGQEKDSFYDALREALTKIKSKASQNTKSLIAQALSSG